MHEKSYSIAPSSRRGLVRPRARGALLSVLLTCCCLPAALMVSSVAAAAEYEPDEAALEQARQLFARGKASMGRGEWSDAAADFREAARIKDTPGLRYHVAFCEENAERFLSALAEYEAAGQLLTLRPAPDVEVLLGPALARLEEKTPEVRLEVLAPVAPTVVSIDGRERADWRNPIRLDPGRHWVHVEAPEHRPMTMEFTLGVGQRHALRVTLQPKSEPPAPVRNATRPPRSDWRTPVLVTGAAMSLAGLGVGAWGLVDRSAALDEAAWARRGISRLAGVDGSCDGASGGLALACSDLAAAGRREARATQLAIGGLAAFGVGAAVTVTSLLVWPGPAVEVGAVTGPDLTGMRLRGRF